MKKCFKCGSEKEKSEFYRHKCMSDGLLGKCKSCTKIDVQDNRSKRRSYYNEYDRARQHKGYAARRKWAIKNKGVLKAHRAMYKAIDSGELVRKPCEVCGDVKSKGHHENYSKPLEVVWLCQTHHHRRHAELKSEGVDIYKTVPKF